MTYNVSSGTLNIYTLTHSHLSFHEHVHFKFNEACSIMLGLTKCNVLVTLLQLSIDSSLKITNHSFRYAPLTCEMSFFLLIAFIISSTIITQLFSIVMLWSWKLDRLLIFSGIFHLHLKTFFVSFPP